MMEITEITKPKSPAPAVHKHRQDRVPLEFLRKKQGTGAMSLAELQAGYREHNRKIQDSRARGR